MNQKQYEAMQTIMQCSRVFCDSMYRAMENAGLLDQGYKLAIRIKEDRDDLLLTEWIELENNELEIGSPVWHKNRMEQYRVCKEGWRVCDDPIAKKGTVPELVGKQTGTDDRKAVAETSAKPYPPDNMWISSRDDYPVLDGWQ